MDRFRADISVDTVSDIDPAELVNRGVKWLAVDVDNTLALPNSPVVSDKASGWLARVKNTGMPVVLVSNNHRKRVSEYAAKVGLPYVSRALKPLRFGLKKAARISGYKLTQGALIGDQIFTDVYAARRAKMTAVLVQPMVSEKSRFFSVKRRLERYIIDRNARKGD